MSTGNFTLDPKVLEAAVGAFLDSDTPGWVKEYKQPEDTQRYATALAEHVSRTQEKSEGLEQAKYQKLSKLQEALRVCGGGPDAQLLQQAYNVLFAAQGEAIAAALQFASSALEAAGNAPDAPGTETPEQKTANLWHKHAEKQEDILKNFKEAQEKGVHYQKGELDQLEADTKKEKELVEEYKRTHNPELLEQLENVRKQTEELNKKMLQEAKEQGVTIPSVQENIHTIENDIKGQAEDAKAINQNKSGQVNDLKAASTSMTSLDQQVAALEKQSQEKGTAPAKQQDDADLLLQYAASANVNANDVKVSNTSNIKPAASKTAGY